MSSNATAAFAAWQQQDNFALKAVATGAAVSVLSSILYSLLQGPSRKGGIPDLGGVSILTAWPFFSRRFDFLRANFKKIGEPFFRFKVLQVIADHLLFLTLLN